jgi:hypothetical protein
MVGFGGGFQIPCRNPFAERGRAATEALLEIWEAFRFSWSEDQALPILMSGSYVPRPKPNIVPRPPARMAGRP